MAVGAEALIIKSWYIQMVLTGRMGAAGIRVDATLVGSSVTIGILVEIYKTTVLCKRLGFGVCTNDLIPFFNCVS